jgi:hypothetical protein
MIKALTALSASATVVYAPYQLLVPSSLLVLLLLLPQDRALAT